ncbi:AMP-dependent synthetase [Amycolatopsis antarctica]|uniref:AMP-dependent synthetase n=1 Tax=Amycolatopsis antarctica TaxID=1854586 RepID=A0A263DCY6_9PSEU|nr:o-succinylbenzoate--CoA ligase [Amycolatopsis antarctica]OZM75255.1 AMP-dependent synthetase [Amycolatopsis antarctica]
MRVVWTDGGPDAVGTLREALAEALDGGPAVLPLNTRDPAASTLHEAMRPEDPVEPGTAVVVATSGSTGEPKGVLLSPGALLASADAAHSRIGGPGHWLLATPAHYVGGLQVLVRSWRAGTVPVVLDTSAGFRADAFAEAAALLDEGPRYTALVPAQLARLLDAGGRAVEALAGFDAIVLGGAALDARLRERARFAGARVCSAYGMSETAGGCVYEGVPLDGVTVRLGEGDRVEIGGPTLAHGYRSRPGLSREAFGGGWFRTSDLGRLDDGLLEVLGRADDVINTGGVKVPAATVERALLAHPGVAQACVVGVPDPQWGQAVVAVVVPAGAPPHAEELRSAVRAAAGAPAVPKQVEFASALPLRGPGKVDRAAVLDGLGHG